MRALLLSLLLLPPAASAQDEADYEARLTEVSGEVTLYTPDQPEGLPAEKDTPLAAGDRLVTADGASAEVALDADHVVSLREGSDLTIGSVARKDAFLKLSVGTLLAKVKKLMAEHNLRVRTPSAVAAVRGTEFGVEVPAEKTDETHVGVFDEGKVEVIPEGETKGDLVTETQEIRVVRGQHPLPPHQLKRLLRHRRFMRDRLARRPGLLRAAWKRMTPEQRAELRKKRQAAMLERRRQRLEKLKDKGRKPNRGPHKGKSKEDERKREERRNRR